MAAETDSQSRISVSEERLRRIFAEFKIDLVREFADKAAQDALETRVYVLELWRAARDSANETKRAVSSKQLAWIAALAGLLALVAGLVGSITTLVWLHHG